MKNLPKNPREYIESNVAFEPNTGCWLWMLLGDVGGYGRAKCNGLRMLAHRLAYSAYVGEIPNGMDICHRCDTPLCVNPAHLFPATHVENMRDMRVKGRANGVHGEASSVAKLTDANVVEILESIEDHSIVAARLGVTKTTVSDIRKRRSWRHVCANPPPRYNDGRTRYARTRRAAEDIEHQVLMIVGPNG